MDHSRINFLCSDKPFIDKQFYFKNKYRLHTKTNFNFLFLTKTNIKFFFKNKNLTQKCLYNYKILGKDQINTIFFF